MSCILTYDTSYCHHSFLNLPGNARPVDFRPGSVINTKLGKSALKEVLFLADNNRGTVFDLINIDLLAIVLAILYLL